MQIRTTRTSSKLKALHRSAPSHSVSANDRPDYPSRLFGSKSEARASLDQLKEKDLIQKDILIEEYGQFTVYWPIEELRAEASEGRRRQAERPMMMRMVVISNMDWAASTLPQNKSESKYA